MKKIFLPLYIYCFHNNFKMLTQKANVESNTHLYKTGRSLPNKTSLQTHWISKPPV